METRKYKHLCEGERYMIVAGLRAGHKLAGFSIAPLPAYCGSWNETVLIMVMTLCWRINTPKQSVINHVSAKNSILTSIYDLM